jgi:pantoate--beta-alanine ligase
MGRDDVQIVVCPTSREADGLAMSSRNRRLTDPQRSLAGVLYQCLVSIESKQLNTPFDVVRKECMDLLIQKGFIPEYVEIAEADTLKLLPDYDNNKKMVALIAAKLGNVRLIDNIILNAAQGI